MATKSKVDTKALEEVNGVDAQDNSQPNTDVVHLATECFCDLIAVFGTTEYQAENVARQFVQSADYLKKYKKEQLDKAQHAKDEAEDDVKINAVGAINKHARAEYLYNGINNEYNDLLRFRKAAADAYQIMTGKKYEPLPKRETTTPATRTPEQRLEDARRERGRVSRSRAKERS